MTKRFELSIIFHTATLQRNMCRKLYNSNTSITVNFPESQVHFDTYLTLGLCFKEIDIMKVIYHV